MVDLADRRRVSSDSVDCVSTGHVRTSCVAFVVLVGPRHNLVIRPDCMVLGNSDYEIIRFAPGIGSSLADAMGKAVEKTSEWLMAVRDFRPSSRGVGGGGRSGFSLCPAPAVHFYRQVNLE